MVFMEVNFNCSADGNHTWNLLINDALLSQGTATGCDLPVNLTACGVTYTIREV